MRGDGMSYECVCGDRFDAREDLIDHNVGMHGWSVGDSRRAVLDKYPE